MSGTLIPMMGQPFDPYAGYRSLQGLQAGAEQIQAARLGNELSQLNVARGTGMLNAMMPGSVQPGAGAASTAPASLPPILGPAPQPSPSQGGAPQPGAPGGMGMGGGGVSMGGFSVPPLRYAQAAFSQNPSQAFHDLLAERSTVLAQLASSATNADEWNQNVAKAYQQGWLDPQTAAQYYNHYEKRAQVLASFADANSQLSARATLARNAVETDQNGQLVPSGAVIAAAGMKAGEQAQANVGPHIQEAQGSANANAQYRTTQVIKTDPATGRSYEITVPASSIPSLANGAAGGPQTGADLTNNATLIPAQTFAARLVQAESGGNPNATNSTSTAAGGAQFVDQSWLDTIKKNRPDLAQGKTDQQLLAMRNNPALASEMAVDYARQNAAALQAGGVQPNALTLGLAHRFGAAGAMAVLKAAPNAPIAPLVGAQVMAANPDLRGQTVGSVLGSAFQKYGTAPVDLANASAPPNGASGAAASVPGALGAKEVATPVSQMTNNAIEQDGKEASEYQDDVGKAVNNKVQLGQIRELSADTSTGAFGEMRSKIANILTSLPGIAGKAGDEISKTVLGMDASKAQELAKYMVKVVGSSENQDNPRGGIQIFKVYQNAYPGMETQPTAIHDMSNVLSVMQQREIDLGQRATQFYNTQFDGYRKGGDYQRLSSFEQQFNKENPPEVYSAAAAILNGKPVPDWSKGLTRDQQVEAVRIAARTNPAKLAPVAQPIAGAPASPAPAATPPASPAPVPAGGPWQPGVAYPPNDWRHFVQPSSQ